MSNRERNIIIAFPTEQDLADDLLTSTYQAWGKFLDKEKSFPDHHNHTSPVGPNSLDSFRHPTGKTYPSVTGTINRLGRLGITTHSQLAEANLNALSEKQYSLGPKAKLITQLLKEICQAEQKVKKHTPPDYQI
jgi:hypothetical protein